MSLIMPSTVYSEAHDLACRGGTPAPRDWGHGVPAHDQALHMTITRFTYSALIERDLGEKVGKR
jgi:hypothetical protein